MKQQLVYDLPFGYDERTEITLTPRNEIVIKHPDLDIRRDAQGKVWIAGIPIEGHAKGGDPASARTAADWFLGLPEFVIEKGRVQWTDELLKTPTLALSDLDLEMRNRRGVTLTPAGRDTALRGCTTVDRHEKRAIAILTPAERTEFMRLLHKLVADEI